MENISAVTSIILAAYTQLEDYRYLYFVCILLVYILIFLVNSVLIFVIYNEASLHKPMYLFICNLSVNAIFGSTCLLPSMLALLSSRQYEISLACCLLQIYFLYSYATIEFTILAVMSYDRYAAICHPLHYHNLMSPRKVYTVIALSWVIPCIYMGLYVMLTVRLTFCGKIIDKVYCMNFPLVKLSCSDTTIPYYVGMASLLISPCSQIIMILFSYAQILRICLFASKESQMKAFQTCMPHIVTVMIYSLGVLVELLHNYPQFHMSNVSDKARIFISLYFWINSPLCNPVVYGMSIQAIRVQIFKLFIGQKKVNELDSRC